MITIFKNKKDIPEDKEYVELNDIFFNQNTAGKLDERASLFIEKYFVYSEYAMIPFSMCKVEIQTSTEIRVIDDYEELKEWWESEE